VNSKILGHRGAKGERPENTIKGIKYAIDCGVEAIEIDVHKSKEG
jgi:glycerophosphoryl diester phosphodiesterase